MSKYEFTLILTADPTEEEADKLYGAFNDGTIATIAGVAQIQFHREASSLEDAIRSAVADVRSDGFDVERIEIERDLPPVRSRSMRNEFNIDRLIECYAAPRQRWQDERVVSRLPQASTRPFFPLLFQLPESIHPCVDLEDFLWVELHQSLAQFDHPRFP